MMKNNMWYKQLESITLDNSISCKTSAANRWMCESVRVRVYDDGFTREQQCWRMEFCRSVFLHFFVLFPPVWIFYRSVLLYLTTTFDGYCEFLFSSSVGFALVGWLVWWLAESYVLYVRLCVRMRKERWQEKWFNGTDCMMNVARLHGVGVSVDFTFLFFSSSSFLLFSFFRSRVDAVFCCVCYLYSTLGGGSGDGGGSLLSPIKCVVMFAMENRFSV